MYLGGVDYVSSSVSIIEWRRVRLGESYNMNMFKSIQIHTREKRLAKIKCVHFLQHQNKRKIRERDDLPDGGTKVAYE